MRRLLGLARRLHRSTFARDAGALTAAGGVVAVITTVQGIITARQLGPTGYGVVALITTFPALVLAIVSPDSQHATVRYLAERDGVGDCPGAMVVCKLALLVDTVVGTVTFLLVALTAVWAQNHVVHVPATATLLVVAGAGLLVCVPKKTASSILTHSRRFGWLAGQQVISALLRSALILGLVAAGYGVAGAVWGTTLGLLLETMTLGALALWETRRRWGSAWRHGRIRDYRVMRRQIIRFMAWTDFSSLLLAIPKKLDIVLLGALVGARDVGYYRLARSIASLPNYLFFPLESATFPRLARIAADRSRAAMSAALRHHILLASTFAAASLAGIAGLPLAVHLVVGDAYGPTVGLSAVLLLGATAALWCYWLRPFYMATGQVRTWAAANGIAAVVGAALYVPAVKAWGVVGMAIVQVAIQVGAYLFMLSRVRSIAGRVTRPGRAASPPPPSREGRGMVPKRQDSVLVSR